MRRVKLSPQAESDIEAVAIYGIEQFGAAQADLYQDEMFKQFDLLAEYPRLGLPIPHPSRELYRFGYGSHVIIYSGLFNADFLGAHYGDSQGKNCLNL